MGALRWLWQRFLTKPENMGGLGLVLVWGGAANVFGAVRFACQLISLLLLVGVPAVLRRWLPWHTASEMARSLVPSWLAAAAAILTWLYIVLLHFGGGALAHDPVGLIVVAGIGAASLLAPLFQFIARSCWEYGSLALLDPLRWRSGQDRRRRDPALTRGRCFRPARPARNNSGQFGSRGRLGLKPAGAGWPERESGGRTAAVAVEASRGAQVIAVGLASTGR